MRKVPGGVGGENGAELAGVCPAVDFDKANGGTWLRVEFSGSWGLDRESAQSDTFFTEAYATASGLHADAMGPHDGIFPEVALSLIHIYVS